MGEAHGVDPEVLGQRDRIAGDLSGVGVERLGDQGVVPHVEQVSRWGVLDP